MLRMSVDDACQSDMRIAELASKYEVDTVFYWPLEWQNIAFQKGYKPLHFTQALDIAKTHTVGSHTITHRHLTRLDTEEEKTEEIIASKLALERIFNKEVVHFAPPRGYINQDLDRLARLFYKEVRLTKGTDDEGYKLVHIHPDSGANSNQPWVNCLEDNIDVHLWCHSFELDRFGLWDELEAVLKNYVARQ